jgi:glycosyltransferase involved in cell wall biosynthesis
MLRRVYKEVRPVPNHAIVTMTGFTKKALCRSYQDISVNLPIVYPAVPLGDFWCENPSRANMVVTTGRFAKDKRQLSQIQIAQNLPDFDFHIFGFSGSSNYLERCRDYIKVNQIDNVHLHPDASFSEIVECLQRAKYFLHTLVNEPFGLTAVQAMAAGCIPVVHDSGGQVEAVPVDILRYSKFEEASGIFHHLDSLARKDIDLIRNQLQSHVRSQYGEPIFDNKIKNELIKVLA